jgi:hypothetical protein
MTMTADVETRCIQVAGAPAAGGVMQATMWGGAGYYYSLMEIIYADAYHNDPANPLCHWMVYDAASGLWVPTEDLAALGAAVRRPVYGPRIGGHIHLVAGTALRFEAPAGATAGSVITINACVSQLRGVL